MRFLRGLARQHRLQLPDEVIATTINGLPGFVLRSEAGAETLALEISDGAIVAIYGVRNPDKLRHLTP